MAAVAADAGLSPGGLALHWPRRLFGGAFCCPIRCYYWAFQGPCPVPHLAGRFHFADQRPAGARLSVILSLRMPAIVLDLGFRDRARTRGEPGNRLGLLLLLNPAYSPAFQLDPCEILPRRSFGGDFFVASSKWGTVNPAGSLGAAHRAQGRSKGEQQRGLDPKYSAPLLKGKGLLLRVVLRRQLYEQMWPVARNDTANLWVDDVDLIKRLNLLLDQIQFFRL